MTIEAKLRAELDKQFREDQQALNRSVFKIYQSCETLHEQINLLKSEIETLKIERDNVKFDLAYYKDFYDKFHAQKAEPKKVARKRKK